jgi:hypothetical protein
VNLPAAPMSRPLRYYANEMAAEEAELVKTWMCLSVIAMLAVPTSAYADDPTGVLLQERGEAPVYPGPGPLPEFTEGGVCFQGMHSEPFPNLSGYRCIRNRS